jgi:hypothetical protein
VSRFTEIISGKIRVIYVRTRWQWAERGYGVSGRGWLVPFVPPIVRGRDGRILDNTHIRQVRVFPDTHVYRDPTALAALKTSAGLFKPPKRKHVSRAPKEKLSKRRPSIVQVVYHKDYGRGRITGLNYGDGGVRVRFEKSKQGKYSRVITRQYLTDESGDALKFVFDPPLPTFDPVAKAEAREKWLAQARAGFFGNWGQTKARIIDTSNGNRRKGVERACTECGKKFIARRDDAQTCSPACRKKRSRQGRGKQIDILNTRGGGQFQEWSLEHNG